MNRKELSKKLKKARIESGLKQEEIAELMNLPISGISVIEKGNRKVDVLELIKFAEFYSKPIEWFFREETKQIIADGMTRMTNWQRLFICCKRLR